MRTSDGIELGIVRDGEGAGPLLLLVHGGATDLHCFDPLMPLLVEHHEVVRYDRRGRGISGGEGTSDAAREVADLLEVAEHVGAVDVFGYSYGGMTALHALATSSGAPPFRRVAVYEPPFNVPGMPPDGVHETVRDLLAAGDVDGAMAHFVTKTFRLPEAVVAAMQTYPTWEASRQAMPTLEAEFAALKTVAPPTRLPEGVPVLHLVAAEGGNPAFRDIAALVAKASPSVEVRHVGGIPHFAIATDTAAVAAHLLDFFGPSAHRPPALPFFER